ncbi:hypothetical protein MTR67_030919 [Solanum verrucosum]|uniref:Uncharacterized protein n=1 Tax=Solanum verrucosum TaxID=315347 RepID=A0AAF0ZGT3_SOLVR|nr:hypothetical protein MTR67_030919 [Solanum verrucosum]
MEACSLLRARKMIFVLRLWYPVKLSTMKRESLFRL